MRRRAFVVGLSGLAGCKRAELGRGPGRLNVFNWSDYAGQETIPRFQREFGAPVRYGVYESNEEMLAKVFGGNSGWDVVFPSNSFIEPMAESRLLAELDPARLANLGNLDGMLRRPLWDAELNWCVPFMWGATGIIYNRSLDPPPAAWEDLWSPRLKGRMTMLDDPADAIGAALKKLGLPLNSADPAHLEAAKRELLRQKPLVRAYLNAEVRDQLRAGDLVASQLWTGTAMRTMASAPHLAFAHPREGFALYCDCVVILRESRRQELAHQFINYLLRPQVSAEIARESMSATANGAARKLLDENPVLYPPAHVLARGEWLRPVPAAAQRLRDRIWTEVKAA